MADDYTKTGSSEDTGEATCVNSESVTAPTEPKQTQIISNLSMERGGRHKASPPDEELLKTESCQGGKSQFPVKMSTTCSLDDLTPESIWAAQTGL